MKAPTNNVYVIKESWIFGIFQNFFWKRNIAVKGLKVEIAKSITSDYHSETLATKISPCSWDMKLQSSWYNDQRSAVFQSILKRMGYSSPSPSSKRLVLYSHKVSYLLPSCNTKGSSKSDKRRRRRNNQRFRYVYLTTWAQVTTVLGTLLVALFSISLDSNKILCQVLQTLLHITGQCIKEKFAFDSSLIQLPSSSYTITSQI